MKNIIIYFFELLEKLLFKQRKDEIVVEKIDNTTTLQKSEKQDFLGISTLISYKDPKVKSLIWEIKYHRNTKALRIASEILFDAIKDDLYDKAIFENQEYVLVNIPITKEKLIKKGFCHTELLCREVLKLCQKDNFLNQKISYNPNILKKIKETKPQSHTENKEERLSNLRGCFKVENKTDKNIILIDDVTTTGSTIKEAILTLNKSGLRKIICYTLAH